MGNSELPIRVLELRSVAGTGGGPEKTILLGTARADTSAFNITVCYLRAKNDPRYHVDERARALGVKYVEIAERTSLDPAIWRQLVRLARQTGAQIVHAHEYKTDLLAWLLSRRLSVIPLATAHGWTGHSGRERFVYYPMDKRLLASFSRVIAVSGEIKTELVRCGASPKRVTVVLNGIDDRAYFRDGSQVRAARERFRVPLDGIAIGSVGRLEPQKRFDLLLEAFSVVRQHFPTALLLIAGEGSTRAELERQRDRLQLGSTCCLLGHVEDVAAFHHALDLFVQASDYEGTPNSVLEAMAFETPAVVTDAGGTEELLENGKEGLVVRRGDATRLAIAMMEALSNRDATASRSRAARLRVERELSFDIRMRKVEAIYRQLIPTARNRASDGR
jgi:glycosyltransferase involved in cell wall biosynthesis